jgi:hypothetical protein
VGFASLLFGGAPAPKEEKPSTLARLGLSGAGLDSKFLIYDKAKLGHKPAVEDSEDLQRILALPRRPRPDSESQRIMAAAMTARLRLPPGPCQCEVLNPTRATPAAKARGISPCITELNPIQGWYLTEAQLAGGAVGFIAVGGGKTGIDVLLPMVLPGCKNFVLMLPPGLVDQFLSDFELWSQHFRTPNLAGSKGPFDPQRPTLRILKYSLLSRPEFATWLTAMKPDGFGCDEAHELKDPQSARGNRFLRYFEDIQTEIPVCVHSGSLTTRGLEDYTHLSAVSLGTGSPVPIDPHQAARWGSALNPAVGKSPAPMGALRHLCAPGEKLREGFRRRLVETLGVITTEDAELDVALRIIERDPGALPPVLAGTLGFVREREMRPDGEELVEHVETIKVCRQLASGFFYRWRYPHVYEADGTEAVTDERRAEIVEEWFSRRQAWARELRGKLEYRSDLLDSPFLCEEAARRFYAGYRGELPVWPAQTWLPWQAIANRVEYVKEAIWLDDFLVRDAARWLTEGPGIAWYWHRAFGEALAKATGLPCYMSKGEVMNLNPTPEMERRRDALAQLGKWKDTAAKWLGIEDGSRPIICSVKAFHKGINLQSFNRALVCNNFSDGGTWEQLLGREHRFGQTADCVDVFVYRHTHEVAQAIDDAREYAEYTQQTTGKPEKLLYASYSWR